MAKELRIKNGKVFDPANNIDGVIDAKESLIEHMTREVKDSTIEVADHLEMSLNKIIEKIRIDLSR